MDSDSVTIENLKKAKNILKQNNATVPPCYIFLPLDEAIKLITEQFGVELNLDEENRQHVGDYVISACW